MKILLTILFIFSVAKAQTVITISGANDGLNDYTVIKRAADTINAHGGNYIINFTENGLYFYRPPYLDTYPDSIQTSTLWDVFSITNCSNVIINVNGATIKLIDSVPFGVKQGGSASAYIGSLFRFTGCTGITLNNANGNGNMRGMRLLGNYGLGQNPYELEHEGLIIHNSQNVTVNNCYFKNFGRDGIMLLQDEADLPHNDNIYLYNTRCDSNGRNGLSYLGGNNLLVRSCIFYSSGQGRINETPAAGLDIEPERGSSCTNARFVSCIFENNNGYSVTSGSPTTTRYITFDSCKIRNSNNYGMYNSAPFFKFYNTDFYGPVLLNFSPNSGGDSSAYFYKCNFTDTFTGYSHSHVSGTAYYLIALADSTRFSHCNFTAWTSILAYSDNSGAKFDTCNFYALFRQSNGGYGHNCFLLSNTTFNKCYFGYKLYPDYRTVLDDAMKDNMVNNPVFAWINRNTFSMNIKLNFK